jgi:hypothetical protein
VVGHLGETLPFMLPRLERALPTQLTNLDRPVSAYLREHVHYTFSGFNWTPAFLDQRRRQGTDRPGNAERLLRGVAGVALAVVVLALGQATRGGGGGALGRTGSLFAASTAGGIAGCR